MAPTLAHDLREYARLLVTLLPPVVVSATLVVGMVVLMSLPRLQASHWATPVAMDAAMSLCFSAFLASLSLTIRPRGLLRAVACWGIMMGRLAVLAAGLSLWLPPRESPGRQGLLYALVLPTFYVAVGLFYALQLSSKSSLPYSRVVVALVMCSMTTAGYALCVTYAALVRREDTSGLVDVLFSGIVFPTLTAGLVRLVFADLCSFLFKDCSATDAAKIAPAESDNALHRRVYLMQLLGSYGRQTFHSCGAWVQLRMLSPSVFAASLIVSSLFELLGTWLYFRLLAVSEMSASSGAFADRLSGRLAVQRPRSLLPRFAQHWLRARAQEDWRERLCVLFLAEEVGERVNVLALGVAVFALEPLVPLDAAKGPDMAFAAFKLVAVTLAELAEDLVKKRMLRATMAAGSSTASSVSGKLAGAAAAVATAAHDVELASPSVSWMSAVCLAAGPLFGVCNSFMTV